MKETWAAPERNRDPILEVLAEVLPNGASVLEVASGTGQHAAWFSPRLPGVRWTPTDQDPAHVASIAAWRADIGAPGFLAPTRLDVTDDATWPEGPFDAVFCANMIHIAPWEAGRALIRGAGRVLRPGGALILYGPFQVEGRWTAPSNEAFDASLKARDPSWGVRDTATVRAEASAAGLDFERRVDMPANNFTLVFRRRPEPAP